MLKRLKNLYANFQEPSGETYEQGNDRIPVWLETRSSNYPNHFLLVPPALLPGFMKFTVVGLRVSRNMASRIEKLVQCCFQDHREAKRSLP